MDFKHEKLPELYKDCRKGKDSRACYIFHKNGADYLELYILAEPNDWRYVHDNFPMQRLGV